MKKWIAAVCAWVLVLLPFSARAQNPNIVFILADDMGYGDVHALNPKSRIPTPNLDGLATAGMFAIRDGRWKLVLGNGSGGREQPRGRPFQKPYALFDMQEDISERNNVIDDYGEVAARLEELCEQMRK